MLGRFPGIPAYPEAIAVQRFVTFMTVAALSDKGMGRIQQQGTELDRWSQVKRKSTHRISLISDES
jgi:hypothetical protein